jgi:hypothetical protein
MLRLRRGTHQITNCTDMVELLDESGNLVAGIYATQQGLKIVSKYIETSHYEAIGRVSVDPDFPPAILVRLR